MAFDKPQTALEILMKKRGLDAVTYRDCAYGQLDVYQNYIGEWKKIARMKTNIYLGWIEWFYMPDQCWEKPELWEIIYQIEEDSRLDPSNFLYFKGLEEHLPQPKFRGDYSVQRSDTRYMAWKHKYYMAMIRYRIAVTRDDESGLKALAKKYPRWKEPREALSRLEKKSG